MSKKNLLLLLLIIIIPNFYAQNGLPFNPNKKIYIKGNSALIGNSIVSKDAVKPYHENSFNDVLKLRYIDIDKDKNTFSSSQATLEINKETPKIKYAALYWSAIYKYNKGYKKTKNLIDHNKHVKQVVYHGNNERSLDVNTILFKTPEGNYNPINGTIIYDSYNDKKAFVDIKPYVCYADVTSILQSSNKVNGPYTVANIKATEGYVSGGASGGWLLYVIYEDEAAKSKYFTTYNGFVDVFKKPIDILFEDFKAPESGDIKTSLILGALEGDKKFKTDQCTFLDYKSNTHIPLFNKIRRKLNFFNSTITINDRFYTNRVPNSRNTLGFDLLKIDIPNLNNTIISNNMTHAEIRFKTKADRFYLFFVAFETEINPIYLESKKNKKSILVFEKKEAPKIDVDLEKIKNIQSISIPSIPKGYYLVTNVFSIKENATKWMAFLEEKGHTPKSYVNPKNGWNYIYLKADLDPNAIFQKRKELSKVEYFEDIWILKINF